MIVADRPSLPARNRNIVNGDEQFHDLFSVIVGEVNDLNAGDHFVHGKLIDLEKRQYLLQFRGWNLPDQPSGYIKPKKHDFL